MKKLFDGIYEQLISKLFLKKLEQQEKAEFFIQQNTIEKAENAIILSN